MSAPSLLDDPPVGVVMRPLASVEVPDTTWVGSALHRLRALGSDHLVIRGAGPVRAVCEVDLLRHLRAGGPRPTRMLDPVSVLATPVPAVDPALPRSLAAELLLAGDRTLLLVVADGEPRGVLDARTLLHSVAGHRVAEHRG
jgi:CBS domain-containing protein